MGDGAGRLPTTWDALGFLVEAVELWSWMPPTDFTLKRPAAGCLTSPRWDSLARRRHERHREDQVGDLLGLVDLYVVTCRGQEEQLRTRE